MKLWDGKKSVNLSIYILRTLFLHKFFLSSLKKPKRKNGYDEKANASSEALAMNIDELVEGLEEE